MDKFSDMHLKTIWMIALMLLSMDAYAVANRDRNSFHHRHYNLGGVCLLSSYGFMLEYSNSTNSVISPFDNYDVMSKYLKFHNTLESVEQLSKSDIIHNTLQSERIISKAINNYCIARKWSGYKQIQNYHDWLTKNSNWTNNLEIVEYVNSNNVSCDISARLASFLKQNPNKDAQYDYAALICYQTGSGPHSVFIGYDNDFFIRDVNFHNYFTGEKASFDFIFGKDNRISEYLLFKVKRVIYNNQSKWNRLSEVSIIWGNQIGNGYKSVTNKIPVKHIRLDVTRPIGVDGTKYYTEITLKSISNPAISVIIGNYHNDGNLIINDKWEKIGMRCAEKNRVIFEYDLSQIATDLIITAIQNNTDQNKIYIQ